MRHCRLDVEPDLERILAKMLARNPLDRYQTPGEVAKALRPHTRSEMRARSSARSVSDKSAAHTPKRQDAAKCRRATIPPTEKEFDSSQVDGELEPRRRVIPPFGIALAGAVALLGILTVVIVLVANSGAGDPKKGQGACRQRHPRGPDGSGCSW